MYRFHPGSYLILYLRIYVTVLLLLDINAVSGLTYEQLRVLFHMLKRSRKKLNGTPLVDVESGNGDKVQVYL